MRDGEKFRLGDLCSIIKGETPIKQAVPGPYPLVVTAAERASHESYQFDCKAVIVPLVSSTGHGHASIKRINYQVGKFALGSILCAVIPKDEQRLNPKFLHVYSYFKDQLIVPLMKGSANVSLSLGVLADLKIIVPPMAVQQRVIDLAENDELMKPLEHEITHQQSLLTKLKQAILQEAIQGKLTADWREANPDTEPASELLKRIQAEKAKLIAAKKLKKEKSLPSIKPEEIPFEIPEGWEWCRLGAIARHSLGKMLDHGKNKGTPKPYLRNLNVQWFRLVLSDLKEMRFEGHEIEKYSVEKGDIVICEGGYPGQAAIWEQDEPIMFQKALHRVRFIAQGYEPVLFVQYLKLADEAGFLKDYYTGSGIKHFTGDALHSFVLPLPPIAEQAAIIERVEALMETCRDLETEIENSRTHASQLLQAILKEAFAPAS
jgi:type I restriction enzyme S subunit